MPEITTIEDVLSCLRSARNVVVLTGAGVSVSCGIPDFRSEGGVYDMALDLELPEPECAWT